MLDNKDYIYTLIVFGIYYLEKFIRSMGLMGKNGETAREQERSESALEDNSEDLESEGIPLEIKKYDLKWRKRYCYSPLILS